MVSGWLGSLNAGKMQKMLHFSDYTLTLMTLINIDLMSKLYPEYATTMFVFTYNM